MVLENPAALFLFLLVCDLYSMGEYKIYKVGSEEPEEDHEVLRFLKKPNPMQTEEQFAWDYMFWRKLGCASLLFESNILKDGLKSYWLSPDCIDWPKWFEDNKGTLFMSDKSVRELNEKMLKYKTSNQELPFKFKNLKQFFDISNGINGWFNSPSRLDALHKIVQNSENALDSKNINSHFASKFLVAGKHDVTNTASLPFAKIEKNDLEQKMLDKTRRVHGMPSMVDIKRFIDKPEVLKSLDDAYLSDAMKIGQMLKIPQDVIGNLTKGSTYENQEMARAAIVYYALQPDSEDFCKGITDFFGITDYVLKYEFGHLPFVQAFEKSRSEVKKNLARAFVDMVNAGADQQEAADYLGIEITKFGPVNNVQTTQDEESKLSKVV